MIQYRAYKKSEQDQLLFIRKLVLSAFYNRDSSLDPISMTRMLLHHLIRRLFSFPLQTYQEVLLQDLQLQGQHFL